MFLRCLLQAAGRTGVARACHQRHMMGSRVLTALVAPSNPRIEPPQPPPGLAAMHSWAAAARARRCVACSTSGAGASSAFEGGWYADENRVYHPLRALSFWTKQEPAKEHHDEDTHSTEQPDGASHAKPSEYPQPLHVQREIYTVNVGMSMSQRCTL